MIAVNESSRHEEVWLLLPWLANGRLSAAERDTAESHLRRCSACAEELVRQQRMGAALAEPDRVTYAPGPSFRKLLDRIDAEERGGVTRPGLTQPGHGAGALPSIDQAAAEEALLRPRQPATRPRVARLSRVSLWRPPGLAWAASFLVLFGLTALTTTAYRWSQPRYQTHTAALAGPAGVLHIALNRSVPIGEVEELLHASGARIVEGPGNTGILGVTPAQFVAGQTSSAALQEQLRALSARLQADTRVLWVQPLSDIDATTAEPAGAREP